MTVGDEVNVTLEPAAGNSYAPPPPARSTFANEPWVNRPKKLPTSPLYEEHGMF
jgi:hypothetical protein